MSFQIFTFGFHFCSNSVTGGGTEPFSSHVCDPVGNFGFLYLENNRYAINAYKTRPIPQNATDK